MKKNCLLVELTDRRVEIPFTGSQIKSSSWIRPSKPQLHLGGPRPAASAPPGCRSAEEPQQPQLHLGGPRPAASSQPHPTRFFIPFSEFQQKRKLLEHKPISDLDGCDNLSQVKNLTSSAMASASAATSSPSSSARSRSSASQWTRIRACIKVQSLAQTGLNESSHG
ncbi:hypothetical protein L3X38_039499 [Prunus dulcis]|uniref:Uncharacterized protein n=1 Tax=Prunus dulcis TaxID=3755 RepID=A0AAD4YSH3_PRUDU|nr:hypothetical protein L3X38_039499 [Prunus dulcis]